MFKVVSNIAAPMTTLIPTASPGMLCNSTTHVGEFGAHNNDRKSNATIEGRVVLAIKLSVTDMRHRGNTVVIRITWQTDSHLSVLHKMCYITGTE